MEEILISKLMTDNVIQVTPKTYLKRVVTNIQDNQQSCVIVTNRNVPLGIITKSDLVKVLAEGLDSGLTKSLRAESIMSSPAIVFNNEMSAFEVLFLAQTQNIKHLPIVDKNNKLCGLVTPAELLKHNFQMIEALSELERRVDLKQSDTKQLLGIGDRNFMQMDLQFTHELSLRYDRPYGIILFQLDYFDLYCKHYGRGNGWQILKKNVDMLKLSVRGSDRIYQYDDSTLFVLLPETDLDSASLLADRLINRLADIDMPNVKSPAGIVTASAGVSSEEPYKYKDVTWEQHLERANEALKAAKDLGHNQSAINERVA